MKKIDVKELQQSIIENSIDVFISSASFEERCFVIPNVIINSNIDKKLYFYNSNEVASIKANATKLCGLDNISNKIELRSNDPVYNYKQILKFIDELSESPIKLNILVDTTTFTRESLLVLIKIFELKKETLGKILCCYVGAKEYSINITDDSEKWLTKGIDEIRSIIGYSGLPDPTLNNHLVILLGFEYDRTKNLIDSYEYKNISIGYGNESCSIQPNHQEINEDRHAKLVIEYPDADAFCFSLTNTIQAKKDILEHISKSQFKNMNTVIVPMNNKISTIAAGLAAIENQNIQLAYVKPTIYNTDGYSTPNDDIYLFELKF